MAQVEKVSEASPTLGLKPSGSRRPVTAGDLSMQVFATSWDLVVSCLLNHQKTHQMPTEARGGLIE